MTSEVIELIDYSAAEQRAEVIIDLRAIARNTKTIAGSTNAQIMAVVKADGFGHGMLPIANTALAHGAQWLGVTTNEDALHLREAGISAPILSWMHVLDEDFSRPIAAQIDLSASSPDHLQRIADHVERANCLANIHLKIDTGLSRNGASSETWPDLVQLASSLEKKRLIKVRGIWSHLADADRPGSAITDDQFRHFRVACEYAEGRGIIPKIKHIANSAATLSNPASHFDLVRIGISLYGVQPVVGKSYDLTPAMTVRAKVIMVKRVSAGTGVSYNHTHVTEKETTLVLIPLGYADGVPRRLSNRGEVFYKGERKSIVGLVATDQFVVDMGDADCRVGDEVTLFGPGHHGEPTAEEWAEWAGTDSLEILIGTGRRIARRYVGVDVHTLRYSE
jgi:alanine racemase